MELFLQQLFVGLAQGSVYALVAYGYGLIFATSRIVNFAQGHLFMIGGLLGASLLSAGLPYWAMLPVVVLVVAAVGLLLERSITLPLRASRSPYTWIVATLAAAVVLENVAAMVFGREPRSIPPVATGQLRLGDVVVDVHNLVVLIVALAVMVGIEVFLARTFVGRAIRATADNPAPARLVGVPVPRLVMLSFALAGAIAGLGGVLVAPVVQLVAVPIGLLLGLKGFIAAVIGGLGSFAGALVGGLTLGLMETVVRQQLPAGVSGAILFGLLLLSLVVRPNGLFGKRFA
jgi:branched-chain amino acid transport system permease protein